jgi:hypothetical protein
MLYPDYPFGRMRDAPLISADVADGYPDLAWALQPKAPTVVFLNGFLAGEAGCFNHSAEPPGCGGTWQAIAIV